MATDKNLMTDHRGWKWVYVMNWHHVGQNIILQFSKFSQLFFYHLTNFSSSLSHCLMPTILVLVTIDLFPTPHCIPFPSRQKSVVGIFLFLSLCNAIWQSPHLSPPTKLLCELTLQTAQTQNNWPLFQRRKQQQQKQPMYSVYARLAFKRWHVCTLVLTGWILLSAERMARGQLGSLSTRKAS